MKPKQSQANILSRTGRKLTKARPLSLSLANHCYVGEVSAIA